MKRIIAVVSIIMISVAVFSISLFIDNATIPEAKPMSYNEPSDGLVVVPPYNPDDPNSGSEAPDFPTDWDGFDLDEGERDLDYSESSDRPIGGQPDYSDIERPTEASIQEDDSENT